eukprot:4166342-Prorocentrum_lima.AAC.1
MSTSVDEGILKTRPEHDVDGGRRSLDGGPVSVDGGQWSGSVVGGRWWLVVGSWCMLPGTVEWQ